MGTRLDSPRVSDKLTVMRTNVRTLLREFPRIRRAVLAGEDVIIETREGNLRLPAEKAPGHEILGSMKNQISYIDDSIVGPTTKNSDWNFADRQA